MQSTRFNSLLIHKSNSIRQAMRKIKLNGLKGLAVVSKERKLVGTLSDGDIRKYILNKNNINSKIENAVNFKPKYILKNDKSYNKKIDIYFNKYKIPFVPIVDENKKIIRFITSVTQKKKKYKSIVIKKSLLKVPTIIMAGGKGTRLQPFTDVLPKPLIPIKKKTVIEHIINTFTNYGVKKFLISINFKAEILKAFFRELKPDYKVSFVTENKPLGTAGSLSKIKSNFAKNIFITNCDIISNVNLKKMYDYHIKKNNYLTLLTSSKIQNIPYGVCHSKINGDLKKIEEKPNFDFNVNVGMYLISNKALKYVPKNKMFHLTDLVKILIKNNLKVGMFKIKEKNWLDVGEWDEFKKTVRYFS